MLYMYVKLLQNLSDQAMKDVPYEIKSIPRMPGLSYLMR